MAKLGGMTWALVRVSGSPPWTRTSGDSARPGTRRGGTLGFGTAVKRAYRRRGRRRETAGADVDQGRRPRSRARGERVAVFPGLALMLAVLGVNLLGDGLRDLLAPRFKGVK